MPTATRTTDQAMSIADLFENAPHYEDIVTAYNLDMPGGDLQVTASGEIAVTADGDMKFGNDRTNAMHRLVQRWCFNAPTLVGPFRLFAHGHATKQRFDQEMNVVAPIAFHTMQNTQRFRDISNEVGAYTFGSAACSGAIMVVLDNLLMRFKVDLSATDDKWKKSSPQIGGRSLGSIIAAAATNFRHHNEWARSNPPSKRQLRSIEVIAAALKVQIAPNGKGHPFRGNVCPQLLDAVSGGNFEEFSQRFFAFAKDLTSSPT
jgi:hypothetical protein